MTSNRRGFIDGVIATIAGLVGPKPSGAGAPAPVRPMNPECVGMASLKSGDMSDMVTKNCANGLFVLNFSTNDLAILNVCGQEVGVLKARTAIRLKPISRSESEV